MNSRQLLELGLGHHTAGRLAEAEIAYRQILAQDPNHPDALHLLGAVAQQVGRGDLAEELIGRAINLAPKVAEYHCTLGNTLFHLGKVPAAIVSYQRCITLRPDYPEVYNNLGNALGSLERMDESIAAYRKALALRPEFPDALCNLAGILIGVGLIDEAIACYEKLRALSPNDAELHSNYIHFLNYVPGATAQRIFEEQQLWNCEHGRPPANLIQPHANDRSPERRLRVGYVSADFRDHVVAWNFLPILENHNGLAFEIFCYSNVINADAMTERIKSGADHWRAITGLDDSKVVEMIRQDGIDILMDLSLHSAGNRLPMFARKPAPVQATFLGYPSSTGLDAIDYRITDTYLDPPGENDQNYSERSIRVRDSFWCYDPQVTPAEKYPVGPLPMQAGDPITFGCLSKFSKVNEPVLELWARVLREVPNSQLLVLVPVGNARQRVTEKLRKEGIDPARLQFVPRQPRREYLKTYGRIDVGLDTFPYNGHSTSLDSFWMGVPVVTLIGQTVVGRAGWSQLCNLDLKDLAAKTGDEFVQIAASLARDRQQLLQLRQTLRQRMSESPLCDTKRFAGNVETAYRRMWQKWCADHKVGK